MTETVHKVRVSRRIQEFLEGTQAWADVPSGKDGHPDDADSMRLARKVMDAKRVKDKSVTVELDFDEAHALYVYTAAMTAGAEDNATFEDSDARSELVSGRALMRKLEDLYGREVTR